MNALVKLLMNLIKLCLINRILLNKLDNNNIIDSDFLYEIFSFIFINCYKKTRKNFNS